ncbi:MAG: Glycosyltransferase family 1 protein [Shouchella clausii]|jgi:glycosyltransferase involved in cell wall biosynthesis
MKKVAHICTSGLSHKILLDKLDLLSEEGYEVHLISSKEGVNFDRIKLSKVQVKFIEMERDINFIKDLKSILEVRKLINKEKYDIVHTHTAKAGIIGRVAAKLSGVPLIIHTSHGLPFYEGQDKKKYYLYKFLERFAAKFSHAIASQNAEDINYLRKISNKPIYYEGNGVDLEKLDLKKTEVSLEAATKKFQLVQNNKMIFCGARFEEIKNHFLLLEALKMIKDTKKHINFTCVFAGNGPLLDNVKNKAKELGLNDNLIFIGKVPDVSLYLEAADVVTLTSKKEGIPRIIMEAMAFSKCVVATNVLGSRELIIDRESGLLVDQSKESVCNAICEVITNERLNNYLGNNARKRIEDHYTESLVVKRIDKMYKDLSR